MLVALAVIVLPGLLDGQKKHYQDEFAAIPLVPKAGDKDENDLLPPASQPIPAQPPEGAAEEVRASNAPNSSIDTANLPANTGAGLDAIPVERDSSASGRNTQAVVTHHTTTDKTSTQPVAQPKTPVKDDTPVPQGKAYVVQLGALKNADKVNEIVSKLRASGYRVYTSPTTPVQGKITRILVGPEVSKDKLKASLGDLHSLSGLNGVVMNYSVH